MNTTSIRTGLALSGWLSACVIGGCVKRTETIRVEPAGAVHFKSVFEGDVDDVRNGDPLLADPGPWSVSEKVEVDDKGKETLIRTAQLTVEPGGELPSRYCADDDGVARWALEMPTSLRVEPRADGVYYHFKRIYRRRNWAFIDYYGREFVEEEVKALENTEFADLEPTKQRSIVRALIGFEAVKTQALADATADQLGPSLRQDQRLAVHQGIATVFEAIPTERIIDALQMDDEQADQAISAEVQRVHGKIKEMIESVLDQADPSGRTAQAFLAELDQQRLGYSITQDIQDDAWEVYLELPGRLLGHNGDGVKDGAVKWEFGGSALCDRDQVLMATSIVTGP
ncbi:MAG: hypothetical protein ACE5GE_10070 [Phycisphaerae bacterium]